MMSFVECFNRISAIMGRTKHVHFKILIISITAVFIIFRLLTGNGIFPLLSPSSDSSNCHGADCQAHGGNGKKLHFTPDYITRARSLWDYKMNVPRSDSLALNREIPDTRPPACKDKHYSADDYASTSISFIVPFYNEPASVLLRAVHSILERTPHQLIAEIILVDDCSSNGELGRPLAEYIKSLNDQIIKREMVVFQRLETRQGLIRARQLGAGLATGEIYVFQDANTESNVGWWGPLLEEIKKNPKTVIQPVADSIHSGTLKYSTPFTGQWVRPGFSWQLTVQWLEPLREWKGVPLKSSDPYPTPSIIGDVIVTSRQFFEEIGGFDVTLDLWGGENLELVFRTWLCYQGAQVLLHPCSRIGHIFRPMPYKEEHRGEIRRNFGRTAGVWLDEYEELFHAIRPPRLSERDRMMINTGRMWRQRNRCKPFKWLLSHVAPDVPVPPLDSRFFGMITHFQNRNYCLCTHTDLHIGICPNCDPFYFTGRQHFSFDSHGVIRANGSPVCIDWHLAGIPLHACKSVPRQQGQWTVSVESNHLLILYKTDVSKWCLTMLQAGTEKAPTALGGLTVGLVECGGTHEHFQKWDWQYHVRQGSSM